MRILSAGELLAIWERGAAQPPARRALDLLAAACPEQTRAELAALSIGQRDTRLMILREWTFGSHVASLASCPGCAERVEIGFELAEICAAPEGQPPESLSLVLDDYTVRFRLPNSHDLAALSSLPDTQSSWRQLLGRCLLEMSHQGAAQPVEQLPEHVAAAVVEQMGRADPQADVQLALSCPACGGQWQAVFDIVSFFWAELEAWAERTLHEIHVLARAYGWREPDILAISPWRRRYYLDIVADERLSR